MIQRIYETHLYVKDLKRSLDFYRDALGLEVAHIEEERRAAFFYVGPNKASMLGIWEKPDNEVQRRHFAFQVSEIDLFDKAIPLLKKHHIETHNFVEKGSDQPFVFSWMPALSIYFSDPDGHSLEFIALLEGSAHAEWGVISYEEWKRKMQSVQLD